MNKAEKGNEIEVLEGWFKSAQVAICGDFRGMTVVQATELRKELKKAGATARVVKNTLARISADKGLQAADSTQKQKFIELLEGPNFVVFSANDPVAPAKVLAKFCKTNDKFKVKGGWVEGRCIDSSGVEALSKLPGRQETLATLLALISAPATQLVRLMQVPSEQVVRVVDAHRQNLEKAGS